MDYINDKTLTESTNSKELTMNNDKENYINSEEAAKYLRDRGLRNITRAKLSQVRHKKQGPDYYKMKGSRQIYYLISELEKWIATVMVPVSPPKEQSSSVATVQQAQTENHSSRATADTTQSPSEVSMQPPLPASPPVQRSEHPPSPKSVPQASSLPTEQSSSVATVPQVPTENHSSRTTADTTQSPGEISIRPSWNGSSTTGSSALPPTDEPESE